MIEIIVFKLPTYNIVEILDLESYNYTSVIYYCVIT